MTPAELYGDLAGGKSSRELDAAICVACQYVPGVPDLYSVDTVEHEGALWLCYEMPATKSHWLRASIPPLTTSLDAVVAMERAKGGGFTRAERISPRRMAKPSA